MTEGNASRYIIKAVSCHTGTRKIGWRDVLAARLGQPQIASGFEFKLCEKNANSKESDEFRIQ
jgi:hypothetical protein